MPTSRSSSSLNTRIFSPTVLLQQDTRRLFITISSAATGYTIDGGVAAGSVIRYDPQDQTYKESQADTEENAEVIGVVESVSSGNYTVVTAGSIAYPSGLLNSIISGGSGGVDVLFLDTNVAGGLTGTVEIPTGSDTAIVKPVIQLAPHSIYNGIIINYIGYKIGNATAVEKAMPVGNVTYSTSGTTPGPYWRQADGFELSAADYPEMYSVYGVTNGPHKIQLTVNTAVGISNGLVDSTVTQFYAGNLTTIGTVTEVNSVDKTITITRTTDSSEIFVGSTVYCKGYSWTLTANDVLTFFVPAINNSITQGDLTLVPYINIKPMVDITIPENVSMENITVTGTADIGSIVDLEQTITQIQNDITTIKNTLRIGGS
jgi:hypothetical protein